MTSENRANQTLVGELFEESFTTIFDGNEENEQRLLDFNNMRRSGSDLKMDEESELLESSVPKSVGGSVDRTPYNPSSGKDGEAEANSKSEPVQNLRKRKAKGGETSVKFRQSPEPKVVVESADTQLESSQVTTEDQSSLFAEKDPDSTTEDQDQAQTPQKTYEPTGKVHRGTPEQAIATRPMSKLAKQLTAPLPLKSRQPTEHEAQQPPLQQNSPDPQVEQEALELPQNQEAQLSKSTKSAGHRAVDAVVLPPIVPIEKEEIGPLAGASSASESAERKDISSDVANKPGRCYIL
ncbi:predicted protein [Uncinocarpus reesii 1704]|uniref:Uncharacterized protein n=1 Tax=Uncinocarpus reesii (strain UAMH 1704) TaxID=336963 RepID=C4JQN8_UNCRE|nr:uncharacterized protein UREG_03383 [Uncinocarpus reesii 1704]EEP78537.1 predicted protein [Uncinocarpus reesii 1704]